MYYVYIASNRNNKVLYTGVTNNILSRMSQHKKGTVQSFTKKYKVTKLLFVEEYKYVSDAIEMEKKIKGWKRHKKIDLIKTINPEFKDFAEILDKNRSFTSFRMTNSKGPSI